MLAESGKIILVYGARQVGKTTLINRILSATGYKTLTVSGDEEHFHSILSSRDLSKLRLLTHGFDVLFIDEAQRFKDIGLNLKILHDQIPALRVIASGSLSFDLVQKVVEPLTGRTISTILYPLSIQERIASSSVAQTLARLEECLIFGSYPEIVRIQNMKQKEILLREMAQSTLYKDLFGLASIKNPDKLKRLLLLLAYQIGSEVSYHELGKQLGLSSETVAVYLDALEKAFIVFKLGGYSKNLRKEISKKHKVYFFDLGVRNTIINNYAFLSNRNDLGQLWENFVITERWKYNANRRHTPNTYFWRLYSGAEIDYIEEVAGHLLGVEIKHKAQKVMPPESWTKAYPKAEFRAISRDNLIPFISDINPV